MAGGDDQERALRDALDVSPDNVPLRLHLADTLLRSGRPSAAEEEFRQVLHRDPASAAGRAGLAAAFFQQGKLREATVLVEALLEDDPDGPTLVLHTRLLLAEGRDREAAVQYAAALALDPRLDDADLTERRSEERRVGKECTE